MCILKLTSNFQIFYLPRSKWLCPVCVLPPASEVAKFKLVSVKKFPQANTLPGSLRRRPRRGSRSGRGTRRSATSAAPTTRSSSTKTETSPSSTRGSASPSSSLSAPRPATTPVPIRPTQVNRLLCITFACQYIRDVLHGSPVSTHNLI